MGKSSWLEELAIKRNSNVSNVFLLETFDPKRIQQLKEILRNREIEQLFKQGYERYLFFNVQSQVIWDLEQNQQIQPDPMQPLSQQLYSFLSSQNTILLISYVFESRHAQSLTDFLALCSHSEELYDHKSTVIVFCSSISLFSTPLLRLVYSISIPPSTWEERKQLLEKIANELSDVFKSQFNQNLNIPITDDLINASSGLTLHDVETASLESFYESRKFSVTKYTEYKIKILKEFGINFISPKRGFESVGGYQYLKDYVTKRVIKVLRNPDIAKKYGLPVPRGILLYGPPGTGKSWFSKALSKEIGLPMVSISPADFLRGIVGETETRVRQITQLIESLSPVLVFIDEFDQLTLSRTSVMMTDSGVTRRMQNMLLEWMGREDRKSFIVGATNFVTQIDSAFLRAGRLDEIIPVLPPDATARKEILKVHTSVIRKVPLGDVDFDEIVSKTYLWTGAELEKLVLEASAIAMDENAEKVSQNHFEEALKSIEVNIQERERNLRRMISELKKLENVNKRFLRLALAFWIQSEEKVTKSSRISTLMQSLR